MPDKIVVTNISALEQKYGAKGRTAVLSAIRDLIAADKKRGIATQLVDISNTTTMKRYKGSAVSAPMDERECKDAVDAIYAATRPDYIVLLDGPDVVPHLTVNNPTPKDKDGGIPSDLPYASDAPFTSRDTAKYAAVTRVVGRLPGITGATNPNYLVKIIKAAASFKSRKQADFVPNFSISARVWQKSTEQSVENIFGKGVIKVCPPTKSPRVRKMLSPLAHFINCHGAPVDFRFYGQRGNDYPVSLSSTDVEKSTKRNTIVAAECCFGAQLYDPRHAGGKSPISNAYLGAGAIGFLGSTTTAYGPSKGNSGADLITQYFLINVLAGASLGRAFLEARQKFVLGEKMEDPVNLKTLAQFLLLGDPSIHPCPTGTAESKVIDSGAARTVRRVALIAAGKGAADSSGFPGKGIARPPKKLQILMQRIARQRGFRVSRQDISAFSVIGGDDYGKEMKARGEKQSVLMFTDHREPKPARDRKGLPETRVLVVHAQDHRVTGIAEYVRR